MFRKKKKIFCNACGKEFNSYEDYFNVKKHPSCMGLLTRDILEDLWDKYRSVTRMSELTGYSIGYLHQLLKKYNLVPSKEERWKLWKLKKNKHGHLYSQVISIPRGLIKKAIGKDEVPDMLVYRAYVEKEGSKRIIVELSEDLNRYVGSKYVYLKKKNKIIHNV